MDWNAQLPELIEAYQFEKQHDLDKSANAYKQAILDRLTAEPTLLSTEEGQQLRPVIAKILKEDDSTPFTDKRKSAQGY